MELFVYDHAFGQSHPALGVAIVPTADIFLSTGERKEYNLREIHVGTEIQGYRQGSIAICCHRATESDTDILDKVQDHKVVIACTSPTEKIAPFASIIEKKDRAIPKDGLKVIQYKTRPGPDPNDKMDTEWLTNDDIQSFTYKPSIKWKDMGVEPSLGTIYLEVLGCDSLPRREKNGLHGDKRDAFVQIIYGDSRSQTDVIESCLSPRWLPWSGRAFTLHIKEQCAIVFLSVFDFDPKDSHSFIGRVAIPLVNFHPNTEYLLDYKIHRNSSSHIRSSFGILKVSHNESHLFFRKMKAFKLHKLLIRLDTTPSRHRPSTQVFVVLYSTQWPYSLKCTGQEAAPGCIAYVLRR